MRNFTFFKGAPRRAIILKTAAVALSIAVLAPVETENAVANGDTRTITLFHSHTQESITATFRVNGAYDQATLEKLNWFLRDWRNDEPTKMDPRLFDAVWETYRESGSREPIVIVSAYRSPETNAMLRRRSRAVAEFSQHMLGKAMDMHYTDVPMSRVREIAMHLQRGGVGYYPTSGTPFVHMDVGNVRAWPRMSYEQLSRLFPDGKTVHLPANGKPLARYEEARAEIEARNGVSVPTVAQVQQKGFFAMLFGGGEDDRQPQPAPAQVRGGPRIGGDARVAGFIEKNRDTNLATRLAYAAGPAPAAPAPAQVAALAPDPAPRKPTVLAEPAPAALAARAAPDAFDPETPAAPLPPRRPSEIALASATDAPLPPTRPSGLGAPAPVAVAAAAPEQPQPRSRVAELPSVITTGGSGPVTASTVGALAYAPASPILNPDPPRPAPRLAARQTAPVTGQGIGLRAAANLRKPDDTATHIDRANFRALTSPGDIAHVDLAAVAPAITGLRAASRADLADLMFAPPTAMVTGDGQAGALVARSPRPAGADYRADLTAGAGKRLN